MRLFRRFVKTKIGDIEPGRQSLPDDDLRGSIGRISSYYDIATPDFPLEYLRVLEVAAIWNPDLSQALSIIVNLGNTGHEIEVDAPRPEVALDRINDLAAAVYHIGGGIDGLVNHFLRQIVLMGALSAEWVVAERISEGISDAAVVPVRTIRFKRVGEALAPCQHTGRADRPYIELNPLTYSYSPVQTMDDSPYGIPGFYAALKNIEIQLSMVGNLEHITRKMGILGFLDVTVEIPEQKPRENDAAYRQRLQTRLKDYAKAFTANFAKGVTVHYKDQEIKHNNVGTTAAAGARSVFQLNEEQIFSALDIPPSMMGRSYSTTETYAGVDFERLLTRLFNYRRTIKRFLEKGYMLDLALRGIAAEVSVHFNENSGLKEAEKVESEQKHIENVIKKRDAGFIDDDEAARELGYEEATGRPPESTPDWFDQNTKKLRLSYDRSRNRYVHKPETLTVSRLARSARDNRVQNYVEALKSLLDGAEETAADAAFKAAGADYDDEKAFAAAVWRAFSEGLAGALSSLPLDSVTDRYVENSWQAYRHEDNSFLQAGSAARSRLKARRANLGLDLTLIDNNALRYLSMIDRYYFGKGHYLADHPVVQGRFIRWLESEYIEKGLNIKDDQAQHEFFQAFKKLVKETSWNKVNQLVDTSMARIQNMGQTMKLYEAGFARYRIVGPRGGPICDYCRSMVGRVFEVEKAAGRLSRIVEKGFEDVSDLPQFLPNKYTAEEVKEMTDDELQDAGFESPPYHPECRHRKAAED